MNNYGIFKETLSLVEMCWLVHVKFLSFITLMRHAGWLMYKILAFINFYETIIFTYAFLSAHTLL